MYVLNVVCRCIKVGVVAVLVLLSAGDSFFFLSTAFSDERIFMVVSVVEGRAA